VDFFARQEQSRRTTRYLVVLFSLAFLACALATATVIAFLFELLPRLDTPLLSTTADQFGPHANIGAFLGIMGGTMALMGIASAYRSATLARGGAGVARMLGGTEVQADTTDPLHRRLLNVVEEMSIASGVPVPDVFVLEAEPGINAFAAGLQPSDAAVAVTRGALERLNRAELQGVIAHEFSHILNGDMRLNQRLLGFSFGILVLALAGRWMLRSSTYMRRGRDRSGSAALALGVALTVIGAIGVFFSRLIKAAVSRQRETLADASAVQFTREPSALAGALKKIGGYTATLSSADSEEVAHMLFGTGSNAFRGWFATHPPLVERIRALEPGFDAAQFPRADAVPPQAQTWQDRLRTQELGASAAAGAAEPIIERAGRIESASVGVALRNALPEALDHAAHSHESSLLLILAMACNPHDAEHERQLRLIEQRLGTQRAALWLRLQRELERLDPRLRLPLLELSIPALKQRPDEQLAFLFDLLQQLSSMHSEYSLFDFVLPRVLDAYLGGRASAHLRRAARHSSLSDTQAADQLLQAVAAFGHDDAQTAHAAYAAGIAALGQAPGTATAVALPVADGDLLHALDRALARLALRHTRGKRALLEAVLATIRFDRQIRTEELELFRAIAATLDCPMPPLLPPAAPAH
jgi:Zn-dependent protease with chaperone function